MKTITLKGDDIVINELKDDYRVNNRFDKVDCSNDVLEPDYELLKAIQTVLEYYMTPDIWSEWKEMNPMVCADKPKCKTCKDTGWDQRTRLTLNKRPCPDCNAPSGAEGKHWSHPGNIEHGSKRI